jgi:hypothetical protein
MEIVQCIQTVLNMTSELVIENVAMVRIFTREQYKYDI